MRDEAAQRLHYLAVVKAACPQCGAEPDTACIWLAGSWEGERMTGLTFHQGRKENVRDKYRHPRTVVYA
jgi:hypothetical protein